MKYLFRWVIVPVLLFFLVSCSMFDEGSDDSDDESSSDGGTLEINLTYLSKTLLSYSDNDLSVLTAKVDICDSDGYSFFTSEDLELTDTIKVNDVYIGTDLTVEVNICNSFENNGILESGSQSGVNIISDTPTVLNISCTPNPSQFMFCRDIDSNEIDWYEIDLSVDNTYTFIQSSPNAVTCIFDAEYNFIDVIDGINSYDYACEVSGTYYIGIYANQAADNILRMAENVTQLELFSLIEGAVSSTNTDIWYELNVTPGDTYQIKWNDVDSCINTGTFTFDGSDSLYTADITATAFSESSDDEYIYGSGWTITIQEGDSKLFMCVNSKYVNGNTIYGSYQITVEPYKGNLHIDVQ